MKQKELGRTGMKVAPLAFGGNVFGWTADRNTSFSLLDAFTGGGFNLIDTADVYSRWAPGNSGGESETIIGEWLKQSGKRAQVIIATKVGSDMGDGKKGLKAAYIRKAAEDSLQRLQTDYIDLYQTHFDDESVPVEEILEAYAMLIKEGKVRAIGTSNMSPERILASMKASEEHGYPRYDTLQPEYNLYTRERFEQELLPICKEYGLSVIPYYSLASGFLTGKYRNEQDLRQSVRGGGISKYLNDRGRRILAALHEVAGAYQTEQASVALAWLISRDTLAAPIASATSVQQLQSLMKAAGLNLQQDALDKLTEASAY